MAHELVTQEEMDALFGPQPDELEEAAWAQLEDESAEASSIFEGNELVGHEVEVLTPHDLRMLERLSEEQQHEPVVGDDLDALLAEAVAEQGLGARARDARAKLKFARARLTPAEVEALERDIERHELVQNWEVVGVAVAFTRTLCECGGQHTAFEALLERQQHRREAGTARWHRVREVPDFARREVIFHEVRVPVCADCAFGKGFDLRQGEVKAHERY